MSGSAVRVYRYGRKAWVVGACAIAVCAGVAVAYPIASLAGTVAHPAWVVALVTFGVAACAAVLIVSLATHRVVLTEDAIEVPRGLRGTRRVPRREIRALRMSRRGDTLELLLEDGQTVGISLSFALDEHFRRWLSDVRDLDQEAVARSEASVLSRREIGVTLEDRTAALARARRVARWMTPLSIAVGLWALVYPRPYALAIGVLVVLLIVGVASIAVGRGVYSMEGHRHDARPLLAHVVVMPGLVIAGRAMLDVALLDPWEIAPWVVCGPPLAAIVALQEAEAMAKARVALLMVFVMSAFAWGAAVEANALLDRSEGETFRVEVIDRRTSGRRPRREQVLLEAWGPVGEREWRDVPSDASDELAVGGEACVTVRDGALGARWYVVGACE